MGRLTSHCGAIDNGKTYYPKSDFATGELQQMILNRLGAYEDTGLNPEDMLNAKPLEKWYEEYGDCLWWSLPIEEPPYCGTPLDYDFPDHVTHFTRLVIPHN